MKTLLISLALCGGWDMLGPAGAGEETSSFQMLGERPQPPEATLYAAIIREISKKGPAARFRRRDRGRFVANAAATVPAETAGKASAKKAASKKAPATQAATKRATSKNTAPAGGTPGPQAVSELFQI